MPTTQHKSLFCFGLGYVATALCEALLQKGWRVSGTVRQEHSREGLRKKGIDAYLDTGSMTPSITDALAQASHILVSVPPGSDGDPIFNTYHAILETLPDLIWLGYLSSTIVYGDTKGAWVTEETPAAPNNARGKRRLAAETLWQNSALASHIFRISGIYGPDRNILLKLKDGTARAVAKPDHVFCRIHRDDIVTTLLASMAQPNPGSIYNLADDCPAASHEIMSYAAQLMELPAPKPVPIDQAGLSPMALSFYDGCRRVKNDKIKNELGVDLALPSYREGLKALVEDL